MILFFIPLLQFRQRANVGVYVYHSLIGSVLMHWPRREESKFPQSLASPAESCSDAFWSESKSFIPEPHGDQSDR